MVDAEVARSAMLFRMPRRRRAAETPAGSGRRKRMAVARLGVVGGGGGWGRRFFGVLRRLRVRWLAALYRRALRRLRASYAKAVREFIEGTVLVGALHAPDGVDYTHAAAFGPAATVGF